MQPFREAYQGLLTPQVTQLIFAELRAVCEGPVVRTQDLTVFNVTKRAIVARQAQVFDQLPPIAGEQRAECTPVKPPPPLIPQDDVEPVAAASTAVGG